MTIQMAHAREIASLLRLVERDAGHRTVEKILSEWELPASLSDHFGKTKIPFASLRGVFSSASRHLGDRGIGTRLHLLNSLDDFGAWQEFIIGAPTLGGAIARAIETLSFYQNFSRLSLLPAGKHAVWRAHQPMANDSDSAPFADKIVHDMQGLVRHYLGPSWRAPWFEVGYPRDADAALVEKSLGSRVIYGSIGPGVAIARADLEKPAPLGSPRPRLLCRHDLVTLLGASHPNKRLAPTMDIIRLRLLDGKTDLEGAAQMLRRGPRSLQSDLGREGVTYRSLVDAARLERAASMLHETDMSLTAIADELGYGEQANFTRAFRRWSGCPPSQFRAGQRQ
jgi:AraC-like DNA-binding protein